MSKKHKARGALWEVTQATVNYASPSWIAFFVKYDEISSTESIRCSPRHVFTANFSCLEELLEISDDSL